MSLYIGLFGPMEVRCDGALLRPLRTRKGLWLLTLLALRQGREVQRLWIAGTLWPDNEESAALYSLRRALTDLRQALGMQAERLRSPAAYSLSLDVENVFVDVIAFDAAMKRGDRNSLEEAIALYRGPLLEGCTEEWALQERAVREQSYLQALETLASRALESQEVPRAISHLQRLLAVDPFRENAVRLLMQSQALDGNYAGVIQTYRDLRLKLRECLSADPDLDTTALYKRLRADVRDRLNSPTSPTPSPSVLSSPGSPFVMPSSVIPSSVYPSYTVPCSPNALIGREKDVEQVTALLDTARLITLTGIGGVGKTRLALAVAEAATEDYRDGACLVELAGVQNPDDVPSALALALGLKAMTSDTDLQTSLIEALRVRQLLLLLDNYEQVASGASFVGKLLQHCPQLTCLVTSRQLLQIAGEHEYAVEPLPLPEQGNDIATLQACSSVQLFMGLARAARPDFQLTEANQAAVTEVCRRLEGLPLAVELTAALVRGLTVQQIVPRLKDRFRLLSTTNRDLTARQRSMRGAIDWSYELLSDEERSLFSALSVFAGSFTIEAVEQVCMLDNGFEALLMLRDKSLLRTLEANGEMRYAMLDTLREYAKEKRTGILNEAALCERYADHYLQSAQTWGASIWSGDADSEIAGSAFEIDLANIRAGMDWALGHCDSARCVPYGIALFRFLFTRGLYEDADARLVAAEEPARAEGDLCAVAGLLNRRGMIAFGRSEFARAQTLFEQSYAISKANDDRAQMLLTLPNLGSVAWAQLDDIVAKNVWEEALALAVEAENTGQEASLRENLGILAIEREDYGTAELYLATALTLQRQEQHQVAVAHALCTLGELYLRQHKYAAAQEQVEEAYRLYQTLDYKPGLADALALTGKTLLAGGRVAEARTAASAGLAIAEKHGLRLYEMYALEALARIAAAETDWQQAETLLTRWYEIARQAKALKHMIDALLQYGLLLEHKGAWDASYRLLRVVVQSCRTPELMVARIAAQHCEALCRNFTLEQQNSLDRECAALLPENLTLPMLRF